MADSFGRPGVVGTVTISFDEEGNATVQAEGIEREFLPYLLEDAANAIRGQ